MGQTDERTDTVAMQDAYRYGGGQKNTLAFIQRQEVLGDGGSGDFSFRLSERTGF